MVLVDTNILLDVASADSEWYSWSSAQLKSLIVDGLAAINPIIYAELAPRFASPSELDRVLLSPSRFKRLPLPYAACFPAARAYEAYRKAGGSRTSPLPDFFIGAHAEAEGYRLLTRDATRYRTYFPKVHLICPR